MSFFRYSISISSPKSLPQLVLRPGKAIHRRLSEFGTNVRLQMVRSRGRVLWLLNAASFRKLAKLRDSACEIEPKSDPTREFTPMINNDSPERRVCTMADPRPEPQKVLGVVDNSLLFEFHLSHPLRFTRGCRPIP